MPGKHVFLSYATEDRDRVAPLVRALEGLGWTVFWDRKTPVGKTWPEVLEQEITTCRSVVVVWSKSSVKSKWVREEADEGERRQVLFPVRIDAVDPPFGYRGIQAADLVGWKGTASEPAFGGLADELGRLLGEPPPNTLTSPPDLFHDFSSVPDAPPSADADAEGKHPAPADQTGEYIRGLAQPQISRNGIYVSYRREDSMVWASRLAGDLRRAFPKNRVLFDVGSIESGEDFADATRRSLASCAAVIVVIGPRWLNVIDDAGQRRLDGPDDPVVIELASSLQREGPRVVPVLVGGAAMPTEDDMPEPLRGLARRNALEITDQRWDDDVSRLLTALKRSL